MKKVKVYDLPTRLFHWLFVVLFLSAFFIAKVIDDDSPAYAFHMLMGLVLGVVVCLRIIWGFIGSRFARFSSFALKPNQLIEYFKQLISGKTARALGHNPASSWAALIMMALALGLAVTGYLMTSGNDKDTFEDVHELFANALIIVAIAHVTGIILHSLRHKDWIGASMVNGQKNSIEGETGIKHSHWGVAILFIALVSSFVFHLEKSYDANTQSLHLFGSTLQLGDRDDHDE